MRLSERLDLLTRSFVDAVIDAIRAIPLQELRPDLARELTPPQAKPQVSPSSRKGKGKGKGRPAATRPKRQSAHRSASSAPPRGEGARVLDDEPKGAEVITNPEELLRAAFAPVEGPRRAPREPRASALLGPKTTSCSPESIVPAQPASIESRIGRVIRRKRT